MKDIKSRPLEGHSDRSRDSRHDSADSPRREREPRSDGHRRDNDYRHRSPNYPKPSRLSFYLGQVFGLVYNLAVVYFAYLLVQQGNQELALKIFAINAGVMLFAICVSFIERRLNSNRGRDYRRFNSNKKR